MREADRAEVWAFGYDDPLRALTVGCELSTHCAVVRVGGAPAAVLGLAPVNAVAGVGAPWLLGTEEVSRQARALTALTGRYIHAMLEAYPHLVNYVHAPNRTAVGWLRRIGFTLEPAAPYGPRGEMFHKFEMKA